MARRPRITADAVSEHAVRLVDERGLAQLTLSNLAIELGVRPSALYTYVSSADHLHGVVAFSARRTLVHRVRNSAIGVSGPEALRAMALAYRGFALDHPGQYQATLRAPAPDETDDETPDDAAVDDTTDGEGATTAPNPQTELRELLALVFRSVGLDADSAERAAASMHSALHGFAALEVASTGRNGPNQDFEHLVDLLISMCPPDR